MDEKAKAFMEAFLKFSKEQETEIPQAFQDFSKQDVKVELKDQQKRLNEHRAILQKIENKNKAIRKDEEQWQNWIQEIRETIKKQKTRRDEQAQKLQEELAALERKEEELGMGKSDNDQNPIQVEDLDAHKGERPGEVRQGEGRGAQQEACGHEGEDGGGIPTEIRDGLQRGQSTHAAPLSYPAGEGDECGATIWRPKHASSGSLARGLLFF